MDRAKTHTPASIEIVAIPQRHGARGQLRQFGGAARNIAVLPCIATHDAPCLGDVAGQAEFDTVNGLAVGEHEADIVKYYQGELIRGPGAFVEVATRQADYPAAIRRKLLRELQGPMIGELKRNDPAKG